MTTANKRRTLEKMLAGCPAQIRPSEVPKWFPMGKNQVYRLISKGELQGYRMTHGYIILKEDFIAYILDHCNDERKNYSVRQNWEDTL